MTLYRYFLSTCLVLLLLILGCSGKSTVPTSPSSPADDLPFIAAMEINDSPGHCLAGYWGISIDTEELTATIEPQRHPTAHMCLSGLLTPLITGISFNPNGTLDVDITIINPYPVNGYDLRGIMFLDNTFSLWNPDDWTSLCDTPDGPFFNPFRAYAKDEPNRIFAAYAEHTETYQIYFPDQTAYVGFGIEASYPGNCEEPYSIENFTQEVLFDEVGSEAIVEIDILDWQDDVNQVILMAQNITNEAFTMFTGKVNETWSTTLVNNAGIGPGDYEALIVAFSDGSGGLAHYDWAKITISPTELTVYDIEGPDSIEESTCDQYSVVAVGDTGITYSWTCDPPSAGYFSHPNSDMTDFCANPVDNNEEVELQVEVNSDGGGPIFKTKNVTIMDINPRFPITWGGTSSEQGYDVDIDSEGNIYVVGTFYGTVDFDPGEDEVFHTSQGYTDIFFSKFDQQGNFQWVSVWGSRSEDDAYSLVVDPIDNIYVTSVFFQEPSVFDKVLSLKKYDSDGYVSWAVTWGPFNILDSSTIQDVMYDDSGNVYITGCFTDTLDLDPTVGEFPVTSNGWYDLFLIKMNENGSFGGGFGWGETNADCGSGLALDSIGNIYITGYYDYESNNPDAVLLKSDSSCNLEWSKIWGGEDCRCYGQKLAVDSNDIIYVTGYFNNTVDFNPEPAEFEWKTSFGSDDVFLSKFDDAGALIWNITWGGVSQDYGNDIESAPNGYIYISGHYCSTVDFDAGPGSAIRTSNGGTDSFICVNSQIIEVFNGLLHGVEQVMMDQ